MARAVTLFFLFAFLTVVLHYIGPAIRFLSNSTPELLRVLASLGSAVQISF